ncbi:MAG TPA: type I methionyl aminopeptidase [Brevibacterium sp.]|nr:type I methionyl aminopeptidase [Brevibacterium sp.]HLS33678.1 type I methionyl aminopeptidase [Brevibacterium sp.]
MFDAVELKSDRQIRTMRRAGLVTRAALEAARAACVPGATTADVDAAGAAVIAERGAASNFKGYHGFPATLCVSVNEVVVHGIPGERVLEPGDMVSIDGGAIVDGLHGDSAMTVFVGGEEAADPAHVRISRVTEEIMWAGIAAMATGKKVGEIGAAIEQRAGELAPDLGLIEDFTGHGIGSQMHMEPEVLNYRAKRMGPRLKAGMCLCIEPMLVGGDIDTKTLDDDWTVVTVDGSRASHWEHSVARHAGGIWVLTSPDGGAERLRPYGVTPAPLD